MPACIANVMGNLISGAALSFWRLELISPVCPRRSTAHTTTSLTEQISLSFRLAPNRSPPAASQPPASSTSVNGAAAQAAAKQASEQAAGQIAAQLAAINATRAASQVTVLA